MLERLIYKNHVNEVINFGQEGIFVNENDLHDFTWNYTTKNNRISAFKRGVVKKTVTVVIACTTEEEGIAKRNSLFEICEKDILAEKYGKIIMNGYYLQCYITASKKSDYLFSGNSLKAKLTIVTDYPAWIKEEVTTFGYGITATAGKNFDYNSDYSFDYASPLSGQQINNIGFTPVNFIIRIYGACINPQVTIAGHDYEVLASIEANEYLTINSVDKTIILTKSDGTTENCFKYRNKDSYIFEKIPVGLSNVAKSSNFKFDITLIEERSEPKWI